MKHAGGERKTDGLEMVRREGMLGYEDGAEVGNLSQQEINYNKIFKARALLGIKRKSREGQLGYRKREQLR